MARHGSDRWRTVLLRCCCCTSFSWPGRGARSTTSMPSEYSGGAANVFFGCTHPAPAVGGLLVSDRNAVFRFCRHSSPLPLFASARASQHSGTTTAVALLHKVSTPRGSLRENQIDVALCVVHFPPRSFSTLVTPSSLALYVWHRPTLRCRMRRPASRPQLSRTASGRSSFWP